MSESRSKAAGSNFVIDMTKGNSMQLILKFTLPLLVGNLFQQVYNVVDSIVVGRHLGANALGGVGSVGLVNFMFFLYAVVWHPESEWLSPGTLEQRRKTR